MLPPTQVVSDKDPMLSHDYANEPNIGAFGMACNVLLRVNVMSAGDLTRTKLVTTCKSMEQYKFTYEQCKLCLGRSDDPTRNQNVGRLIDALKVMIKSQFSPQFHDDLSYIGDLRNTNYILVQGGTNRYFNQKTMPKHITQ